MLPLEKELGEPKEKKPKVLFADDEASMRMFVGDLLQGSMGLSTVIVGSAEEALEKLEEGGITHIITDGFGGEWKRIAQAVREKGIDVTVLSGDEEVKEAVLKEKDIRFLPKPTRLERIKEIFSLKEKAV